MSEIIVYVDDETGIYNCGIINGDFAAYEARTDAKNADGSRQLRVLNIGSRDYALDSIISEMDENGYQLDPMLLW